METKVVEATTTARLTPNLYNDTPAHYCHEGEHPIDCNRTTAAAVQ